MENGLKGEGRSGEGRYKVNKSTQARIQVCLDTGIDILRAGKEVFPDTRTYDLFFVWDECVGLFLLLFGRELHLFVCLRQSPTT